jgi:hypothetical protein
VNDAFAILTVLP